ncbi:hypothetical protein C9E85_09890 [Plesiomonas shigelloides]|nr:hypothetical protein C9E85_09890 [Plesiomonas shigelloides]
MQKDPLVDALTPPKIEDKNHGKEVNSEKTENKEETTRDKKRTKKRRGENKKDKTTVTTKSHRRDAYERLITMHR